MNSDGSPRPAGDRHLFLGISTGFIVASTLVISVAYLDPEWVVWLARAKSIVGGALALAVAMVFFGPHLSDTTAKIAAAHVNDASEKSVEIISELRDRMRARPFLAGAVGAYPLAALVSEQLVSATPGMRSSEITPLWTLAGIALCAGVLTIIDTGRTEPGVASIFLLAMALAAAAAVFATRSQTFWSTASAALAIVLLIAIGLRRSLRRRPETVRR